MTSTVPEPRLTVGFCRGCRYDLAGLAKGACPECGLEFDPQNTASYLDVRRLPWSGAEKLQLIATIYPIVVLGLMFLEYVVGRLTLGHWPRMSIDDPKGVPVTNVIHGFTGLGLISLPLAGLAALALSGILFWRTPSWSLAGRGLLVIVVYAISYAVGHSQLYIVEWWWD